MVDTNIDKEIGKILRLARTTEGLSQKELALMIGYTSPQFVSLFERGISKVPMDTLGKLSVVLKIPEKVIIKRLIAAYESRLLEELNRGKALGTKRKSI
jgi:transcriptional regulator with XRE-family HTH domain